MEQPLPIAKNATLATLATEILLETQKLVGQEWLLAKDELAPNWIKVKKVVFFYLLSITVALSSLVVFPLMLTHLLASRTTLDPWVCDAVVTIGLASLALFIFTITKLYSKNLDLIPKNTVKNFKENLQCLKNRI